MILNQRFLGLTLFSFFLFFQIQAQTTVTFDDQGYSSSQDITASLAAGINGFKFVFNTNNPNPSSGDITYDANDGEGGTGGIIPEFTAGQTITISKSDNSAFQFDSFWAQGAFDTNAGVKIEGFNGGASTGSQTIGPLRFGNGVTTNLNSSFDNVTSVVLTDEGSSFGFDAIFDSFVFSAAIASNTAPTASSFTASNGPFENLVYTFSTSDFGYNDGDGDPLNNLLIESAPGSGTLFVDSNGNNLLDGGEVLSASSTVSKANLDAGRLKYLQNGSTNTSFQFEVNDGTDNSTGNYIATLNLLPVPTVTIGVSPTSRLESLTTANVVTATLSNIYGANTTINFSFSGTAVGSSVDYSISSNTIVIPAGNNSGTINLNNVPDGLFEGNETVIIDIVSVTNGTESGTQQITYTIIDDDSQPTATLEVLGVYNPIADESGGQAYVRANLDAVAGVAVSVPLIFSGTATGGGTDYSITGSTITLVPGETMDSIRVTSLFDGIEEGDETIIIDMGTPTNAIKGTPDQVTITINDEDAAVPSGYSVSIDQDPISPINESAVSFTFAGAELGSTYNFTFSSSGGGSPVSGSGTIVTSTDQITGIDLSGLGAGTITLSATLTDPFGNVGAAAIDTKIKNSITGVSVDDPTVTEGDAGSRNLTFTVSLSQAAPAGGATVDFATSDGTAIAGSDYTATSGTLSFAAGETSKTVDVTVIGDETVELDETLTLTLSNPTGTAVVIADGSGIGTITNDDQAAVTIADVTVDENSGTATLTLTLDNAVDGGFSVEASTADGTATTADGDYTAVIGQALTFAGTAGETETFSITLGADTKVEVDETVSISMSNLVPVTVDPADVNITDGATLTINNDDQATLTIADVSGNEDDGDITVTVTLDNAVDGGFDVDLSTADGTATTANSDYTAVSGQTLSFAGTAGETQTFTVTPTVDTKPEPNETVIIGMSNVIAGTVSSGDIDITDGATVTIINDDDAFFSVNDPSVGEGNAGTSTLQFIVSLSAPAPAGGATVDYATSDGTAIAGSDYTAASGTLSFAAGETSKTIDISVNGDTEIEKSETLTLTLSNPTGSAVSIGDGVGTGLIFNDDFKKATRIYWANGESIQTAKLDGSDIQTVYTGSAISVRLDEDIEKIYFNALNGDVFRADLDGSNVETVVSGASANGIALDLENNKIYWTQFSANKIRRSDLDGSNQEDVISTTQNPFDVWVDNFNNKVYWGLYNGSRFLRSNFDGTNQEDVIFTELNQPWAIQVDALNSKIYFTDRDDLSRSDLDGSNIETLTSEGVPQGLDIDQEAGRLFYGGPLIGIRIADLDGSNDSEIIPSGAAGNVWAIAISTEIIDVSVSINDPSVVEGNSGNTSLSFTISLDNPAPVGGATVDYATSNGTAIAGSDYTATSGTLTFAEGETSKTVDITVIGDEIVELDETLTLTLSNPTGTGVLIGDGTGTGTITNDDQATVTIANVQVSESDGNATISATLDNAVQGGFTVDVFTSDGTATTADSDYNSVITTLTFAGTAGEIQTFDIPIIDDQKVEVDETVSISMSNLAGTSSPIDISDDATLTISNDDLAILTIDDVSGKEDDGAITVTVSLSNSVAGGFTVNVSTTDGTATTADSDYTSIAAQTLTFVGVANETQTFTITPTADATPESDETVIISMSGLVLAVPAGSFDVSDEATVTILNDDVDAPSTPDLAATSDSGGSDSDNITNDLTPTFTGTALVNSTVTVISDLDGILGTTIVDGSGNWSFTATGNVSTGVHSITATATDFANNVSPVSGALSVTFDTQAPTPILIGGIVLQLDNNGLTPSITPTDFLNVQITDDFSALEDILLSLDKTSFDCSNIGNNTVTVTATDEAGNSDFATSNVEVRDVIDPTILAKSSITLNVDAFGTVDLNVGMVDEGSFDNCGIQSQVFSKSTFDRNDEGVNTITYTVTDVNGNPAQVNVQVTIVVVPKVLNIVTDSGQSKVYGDADPVFTFTASGFEAGDDESIFTGALSRVSGENVGTYAINLGTLDAGPNYTINFTPANFEINAATLTITADAGQSKVYGEADPIFTYQAAGFENGDNENILTGVLSRVAGESVGNYTINQGTLDAGSNYTINYTAAEFEITPATLNITADAGQSKVYGNTDPVFSYQAMGFENGDDEGILTGSLSRVAGENVGNYTINQGTLDAGSNYTINYTAAEFEITLATLNITADSGKTKIYGDSDPVFTYQVSGYQNGDDESIFNGALARIAGENVGTYLINLGTLDAGPNYTIDFTGADFTITTRTLNITANPNQVKVFGSADPVFTYIASNFGNGDNTSILTGTLSRVAGEDVGMYAITLGTLEAGSNYAINFTSSDFEIAEKVLNVVADAGQSKVFGTADPVFTYEVTGFEAGDDETILTGALARASGENVGTYPINLGSLDAGINYAINYTGADFEITPAAITGITFNDGSFVFDGTEKSIEISGTLPAGTSVTYANNTRTDVGTQEATATITGSNFNDLVLTADLTITPADITGITFNDGSFVFDGTEKTLVISGTLPAGTSVTYANNSRTDVGTQEATATITGSNYNTLVLTADLTITPADISAITFNDGEFVFDGTEKSIEISGTLPAGTSVTYANNTRTDVGTQEATATITGSNFNELILTAGLTITPAELTVTADIGQIKLFGETDPALTFTATGYGEGDDETVFTGTLVREQGEAV
ncbi:beta strand repeat-containing protein, partial [Algoriphagus formosus]